MSIEMQPTTLSTAPRWRPLAATERRVLGVLIEKAKTTPENYPLSLNALRTGCNQKSNRAPLMALEEEQVAEALENLRKLGAVAEIQGGARVDKYRHLAYDWLGVDKVELAVIAELLLRGSQTVGELRGRAARMEPIKDLGQLQPIVDALLAKGLMLRLTPPGRGSVVTHALYTEREIDKVRREASSLAVDDESGWGRASAASPQSEESEARRELDPEHSVADEDSCTPPLAAEMARLREELAAVRREFDATRAEFDSTARQLRRDLDELSRQLGN